MKPNKQCPNCQSDNKGVAVTVNNTCPDCGRTLDKNLRGIDNPFEIGTENKTPISPMKTFKEPNNDWKKEFDKKWLGGDDGLFVTESLGTEEQMKNVENFISKLLQQQREEIIEEIDNKFPDIDNSEKRWIEKQLYDAKEIHKFLQSLKEKK